MDQEEQKNNRKSALITGGIQVVFLLLLYFLVAWKEPFPPIPEYGIELSFGLQDTGRPATPTQPPVQETPQPETPVEQPVQEEVQEVTEPADQPAETEDINSPDQQEVAENEEVNQEVEDTPEEPVEEVVEEVIEEPTETEEVPEPVVEEPVEEPQEEQPEVALPEETETSDNRGQSDEDGQEGDPEAEIDERALYGNVTGEEGASLELSGWIWDFEPTPYDDSQETGKIIYEITIDDEGYIIKTIPILSTVSPSVEKYYRQAVERLTFSKTSTYKTAPTSSGKITFVIKSK